MSGLSAHEFATTKTHLNRRQSWSMVVVVSLCYQDCLHYHCYATEVRLLRLANRRLSRGRALADTASGVSSSTVGSCLASRATVCRSVSVTTAAGARSTLLQQSEANTRYPHASLVINIGSSAARSSDCSRRLGLVKDIPLSHHVGAGPILPGGQQRVEDFWIAQGQIGQHLAVELDVSLLELMHELAVAQALFASGGVDSHDPQ